MALKIVTGGTTGAADGTLVSSGNPLVIVALNTAVDAHIRCDDGYWSNDQDFDVPAELEVSFDAGSTWYDNADEPITAPEIYAVNVPIKIRQTVAAGSTSGSFVTDGTYTAIAALSTPTLTATVASPSQIDLSWTNVSNEDASPGYTLQRGTDGVTYGTTVGTYAQDVTTASDTGLTASTHYYYRVKAEGSGRYSDSGWGTDDDTTSSPTVTSFYSLSGDGAVRNITSGASWATVIAASSGTDTQEGFTERVLVYNDTDYCARGFLAFDTSAIPDGATILSAKIKIMAAPTRIYTGETASLCVVEGTQASTSALATSDFSLVGSTEMASRTTFSSFTADVYKEIALNSAGLAHISKTGFTKFAFRGSKDVDASTPGADSGVGIYYSEQSGTSKDPVLEVTYA